MSDDPWVMYYVVRSGVPFSLERAMASAGAAAVECVERFGPFAEWHERPRKVAWLFHQHREAYDLFGTPYCSFRDTPEDRQVKDAIQAMDTSALSECRAVYTISRNVAAASARATAPCC